MPANARVPGCREPHSGMDEPARFKKDLMKDIGILVSLCVVGRSNATNWFQSLFSWMIRSKCIACTGHDWNLNNPTSNVNRFQSTCPHGARRYRASNTGHPPEFSCANVSGPELFRPEMVKTCKIFRSKVGRPEKFPADRIKIQKPPGFSHSTDGAHEPAKIPARSIEPGTIDLKFRPPKFFRFESSRAEKFSARNFKNL
jgi:hypothetical protein